MGSGTEKGCEDLGEVIVEQLRRQGVDVAALAGAGCCGGDSPVRVVAVTARVGEALDRMSQTRRDQVVMVRVDEETAGKLDAWVETGAVKSRSEAAALFIREGLALRAEELSGLRDALRDLEEAKRRLRERVQEMLAVKEEARE